MFGTGFVYIMASTNGTTLYIGVTNDVRRRVHEHKTGLNKGFTKQYHCKKLVYFQEVDGIVAAIALEKKMKGWSRWKKERLINTLNPEWEDLALDWYDQCRR